MTKNPVKIAMVVQRYGTEVIGGAEAYTRILAQRLQQDLGYAVDVYTTTSKDYRTWGNYFKPGQEIIDGVTVCRFSVVCRRMPYFGGFDFILRALLGIIYKLPCSEKLSRRLELLWIMLQGPVCPRLVADLKKNSDQYKKIIFVCYLYYPTMVGSIGLENKSILLPLGHDEPAFHFKITRDLLRRMPQIIPNTEPEWDLIKTKLDPDHLPMAVPTGLGFDDVSTHAAMPADVTDRIAALGQYVLYLGRISSGKGVHELIPWFQESKRQLNHSLKLVLAGQAESSVAIPKNSDIEYWGYVSDDVRNSLMAGAFAIVNPSKFESLSMLVIEGMVASKPILARRQCEIFQFFATKAPAIELFGDSLEFRQALDKVITMSKGERERCTDLSREWAKNRFSWQTILTHFKEQIEA